MGSNNSIKSITKSHNLKVNNRLKRRIDKLSPKKLQSNARPLPQMVANKRQKKQHNSQYPKTAKIKAKPLYSP